MQIWERTSLRNRENSYTEALKDKNDMKASYIVMLINGGLNYFLKRAVIEYK